MIEFIKKIRINIYIYLFKHLPIKENKIFFISNLGNSYTCNPKYLCEFIAENYKDKFDMVWVFDENVNIKHELPKGCRKVNYFSIKYLYEILTSHYIISNARIPKHFRFEKRKCQIYIQTWHSSIRLKKIESDVADQLDYKYVENAKQDSKKIDYIISGCGLSSNTFKNSFWYDGKILEVGTPRIDYLLKNNTELNRLKLLNKNNLDSKYNYLLYAPTFRNNNDLSAYDLNYELLCNNLSKKFGGKWKVLYRLHPNLINISKNIDLPNCCINASYFDDIQELLIVSDFLITDYSSCMFDAMYLHKKCALYVNDLQDYLSNNRSLYFNISELPFLIAENQKQLFDEIENYDETEYINNLNKFLSKINSFENGKSCQSIVDLLLD